MKPGTSRGSTGRRSAPSDTNSAMSAPARISAGRSDVAQPRRQVHRTADVVVAFEEDHVAAGEPGPDGQVDCVRRALVEREERGRQRGAVGADEHRAVTEPLRNPHTVLGRDVTHESTEPGEDGNRLLVAVHFGETGETAQVDEGEVATNSHSNSLAGASAGT